jgi:hypothetical protein
MSATRGCTGSINTADTVQTWLGMVEFRDGPPTLETAAL